MADDGSVTFLFERKPKYTLRSSNYNELHNYQTISSHENTNNTQKKESKFKNINIIVYKSSRKRNKPRKFKIYKYSSEETFDNVTSLYTKDNAARDGQKSVPNMKTNLQMDNNNMKYTKSSIEMRPPFRNTFIVNNCCHDCDQPECKNPFINPCLQARIYSYRCQLNTKEETCCCSCNSDAMFEVMKSLYDCYKKKNCDNCQCILCGHLPREERRLGETRKSAVAVETLTETASVKQRKKDKMAQAKAAGLLTTLDGKRSEEKEKIVRGLAKAGLPLPEPKTASEKELIKKVRNELGLPQEPKSKAEKEKYKKALNAGIITPLEGKSRAEKENILRKQAELGIPLPEGRTASEKSLIRKIVAETKPAVPADRLKKAKEEGLLTSLKGKSEQEREKIIKGLIKNHIPLPEPKTDSERKIIDKVKKELDLPPEPKSAVDKNKYDKAVIAGIITPLKGKTQQQKEKILKGLLEAGIDLPEGQTKSEKDLIAKVKTEAEGPPYKVPSEKMKKAKALGLITPLEGKTAEQKEKILRGMAMNGIPLPEGKTTSEKKLIDKVAEDVGLPPSPKTGKERVKYNKALAAGLITPLEGKTIEQKEKILRGQAEMGLPLPEGRTPSEKALIDKVKATTVRKPSAAYKIPSEKMRKAKAAGLLTPLEGKTLQEKEKIFKGLAMSGIPLPEGKTESEKKIIEKVSKEVGLPPLPKTEKEREKYNKALAAGIITPLEGKTDAQKEKILRSQAEMGLPLPEGRTTSEKALVDKVKASTIRKPSEAVPYKIPSEKMRKAKAAGLITPLEGKTPQQKEKILRGLAMHGIPLPEAKTSSEKKLIDKVARDVGLPPPPKTAKQREKYNNALAAGLITPLEGKTAAQKEHILRKQAEMGLPLPEGRTPSEKILINNIKATTKRKPSEVPYKVPSERLRKAKEAGIITPLEGKTPEQKEKILRGLAMNGIPLPEGKTSSEQKLIDKVARDVGLPPPPKTDKERNKYNKALAAGLITPLEGKTPEQKENILRKQAEMGLLLPEGRTASEKDLIDKIKATTKRKPSAAYKIPSEKLRIAKAAGLLTPLEGKTPEQKEKILRGLAMNGIPLPEGTTDSEKKLINKVAKDVGLPPPPKTAKEREKYDQALTAGLITPLEGKTPEQKENILRKQAEMGLLLPEGRTASEKALIDKVKATTKRKPSAAYKIPSEKLRKAKAAGLLTPLEGKTPEQKEKILRGLAMNGIPLPEGTTDSEMKLINKVAKDVGLPPSPKTAKEREKYDQALAAGLITPLEGKSPEQKEKILRAQAEMGLLLPEGRTASEKALVNKVKATTERKPSVSTRKAAGMGRPALPPEKAKKLDKKTAKGIKESAGPSDECICGLLTPESERRESKTLPPGVSPLVIPSEKLRRAKAAGFITPLEGKSPEQKEKILRGQAMNSIPLPEGKTDSEKKLIEKIANDLGLPSPPKNAKEREKFNKAYAAGLVTPLEGKTAEQKEKILRGQAEIGLPLPEGRTPSEKALINNVKATTKRKPSAISYKIPSEKLRKAKAAGLITPLEGKTPEQKEKILRGLAMHGIPLPEGKTGSEQRLIDKVAKDVGLPPAPKTVKEREKYNKALAAGLITPLEGKTPEQKENILRKQAEMGLPLPEGRSPSEKALINNIKATTKRKPSEVPYKIPSEKLRKAKEAGLITPLAGKTPEQKEKILRGLAMHGIPLPEGKTPSEQNIIEKVARDVGLPPPPKNAKEREKYNKALAAGLITPLEGKSPAQKENILRGQAEMGLPLPEGRTSSEKALINNIKATTKRKPSEVPYKVPSERLRKAKEAGLITPLEGKTPEQKEKILRGLAMTGIPLPEGKTPSEQNLINKVARDVGLPPPPTTAKEREKYNKALAAGLITPLEGKSSAQKEKILRGQAEMGLPLPEGRSPSEKALINNIKATTKRKPSKVPYNVPSERLRKAIDAGLITPLEGKTPEQKEKILRGLAMNGIPLPEGKTLSEQKLIDKVARDVGLPPQPKTSKEREKYNKALAAGLITPLEGKSPAQKEQILRRQAEIGLPLPEGRTSSEKALINNIKATTKRKPSEVPYKVASERLRKAKEAGFITPLEGKTQEQKEKILRGLAMHGIPLPEGKTPSEQKIVEKVARDIGLPPPPKNAKEREKYNKALAAGLITPLEGKSPAQKENILRGQAEMGLLLPEGRTPSEKALINNIKATTKRKPSVVSYKVPSEKLRKAKEAGLITPLEGKTPEQKEKILRGLVKHGVPLPEGNTPSEQKIIDKVARDVGLPPLPKSAKEREKYNKALAAGLITPLEGKSVAQKEKILRGQAEIGLPLPEGRTPSEKALINNIKATTKRKPSEVPYKIPSEKLRKAKEAGFITPLDGKTPEQKEKILRGLAMHGIPLPDGKTPSEQKLIDKVARDVGLPPPPKTAKEREKYNKALAAGLITPLEGKSPAQKEQILRGQAEMGLPLPEGRSPSEKALINNIKDTTKRKPSEVSYKVPSEKLRKAKEAGLITPLEGKTPKQKEKILRGLAMHGIPLPEGKTPSEQKIIEKVARDVGLPPPPKNAKERDKYKKALAAGLITPLEGKTTAQKENILRGQAEMGLLLPEGRTPSEKALIANVKATAARKPSVPSRKAAGMGRPALPPDKAKKLDKKTAKGIKESDRPADECICGLLTPESERKEPTAPTLVIPSEKLRKAKAAGLLTPLEGKTSEQKEKILKGLAMNGIPLPEGKSNSEKKLIEKVAKNVGLPPPPKNAKEREKYNKAYAAGLITPLEGKTPEQKENILRKQAEMGLSLPEGRTASEKALIDKVQATTKRIPSEVPYKVPSDKLRKAKAEGFLTPLEGKTPEQKEKILRGLAMNGIPLPQGKSPSEQKLIEKVAKDVGLPPLPKTAKDREKYNKALAAGIITPLEGKSPQQKENILRKQAEMGLPLPEGRTASEKALIDKVKATTKRKPSEVPYKVPSEKMRKAKALGLITPLEGKTPEQKETILKGLAMNGIPLPEGKTPSEQKLIDKVAKEVGLPPPPKTAKERDKYNKALAAGIITPLEGKTPEQKENILRKQAEMGLSLPEGRTASEKALIDKVKATTKRKPSEVPSEVPYKVPSDKLRKAKAEGFLTPLEGKTPEQKEKILRGLAMNGIPLPQGKSPSEQKLIEKVAKDVGLPPLPKTAKDREKYNKALAAGIITPLEGKSPQQKENILRKQAEMGLPLPEGRTASEKALIDKVKATTKRKPSEVPYKVPSEKMRKAKALGLITPLEGKTPEQKETILKGLAMNGIPLPEGKTPSEQKLIAKVAKEVGLPPPPKTAKERDKYNKALAAGIITPLEGKSPEQKENILRKQAEMGLPLPEGRTASEKAIIDKVKATTKRIPSEVPYKVPSDKLRKAKAEGFLTPLEGKSPEQKERILRGLAMNGIPLPEGKSSSEQKLIEKVTKDVGLPPLPKTAKDRQKYNKALAAGVITPLEGKSPQQKENILRKQAEMGLSLPEGRTSSEKALIDKVRATSKRKPSEISYKVPSEKLRKAKALGLITPLEGKTPEQKETILKGLAMNGIPLPEGKTSSEQKLIDKVAKEVGLPPPPKTAKEREKYNKALAAGIITPLEGKTPEQKETILRKQAEMGLPLPEGRTTSEKALIDKVKATTKRKPSFIPTPSEKMRKAKAEGLLTPLEGKTPEQKQKIIRGLAKAGVPLPEGKTPSEKAIINKVRHDLGLPPQPTTSAERDKYNKALAAGIITPLEGKTPSQKAKILQDMKDHGIPLPEGRTPSEKSLIKKIKAGELAPLSKSTSEKMRAAKAAGLLTPLEGKSSAQKAKIIRGLAEAGLPLPEGKTASEKALIKKFKEEVEKKPSYVGRPALPPKKREKLDKKTAKNVKEGKGPSDECICGLLTPESERALPKSKAAIPSKLKIPSEKLRKAKAEGLLTPLEGKTPKKKEKILRGLAASGIPLPEGKTPSEKKIIDKVRMEMGLPPEPKTEEEREKLARATAAGIVTPLEGKSPDEKEKILKRMADAGIALPEGRTASEKAMIANITSKVPSTLRIPSEKIKKAKAAGLITPLEGKTPEQKEKILKGLAASGLPLPEGKTPSEKKLIDKVRTEMGLPPEPKTAAERDKLARATAAGIVTPLEGKTSAEKEKILKRMADSGIALPEGRTASEKALIDKVKSMPRSRIPSILRIPSAKLKKAKEAGLITPLEGKTPEQKEKILRGLASSGMPLPEGKTPSEKIIIDKVRTEMGLPPEPKTASERDKLARATAAGIVTPLEGKTPAEKEKILKRMADAGIALPEGRTPSEKSLIDRIKSRAKSRIPSVFKIPTAKLKQAKEAGFITPLEGKTPAEKEKILRGLAASGIPLPEGKTASEKKLIDKVRTEMGLPPEPKTAKDRDKLAKATVAGIVTPLEGKTRAEKEKALKRMADAGITLPEGRTASEKAMIAKIKSKVPSVFRIPSEKFKKAKAAGFITPLEGKTSEQKEKILKGLAASGLPLPEGKTPSEKKIIGKVRTELGLPPEPKTKAERDKLSRATAAGIVTPLEGKTPAEKEKILKRMADAGIALPEGRTASEKALIDKVKSMPRSRIPSILRIPSAKLKKAKEAGLITPLEGKTPEQKEKILRGLASSGMPLPEGKTPSEKIIIDKVRTEMGLPPEPKTAAERDKLARATAAGIVTPLEGKTPAEKEKILKKMAGEGIALPEGRTASEKALIAKVKASAKPMSVGVGPPRRFTKGIGVGAAKARAGAGIEEELEEIVKTTTCDRACGCNKKKIRFKHSYVKIRVTSPDISSLCPCPDECVPGVKGGVIVDNEGIKVTVGRVTGIPQFGTPKNIPNESMEYYKQRDFSTTNILYRQGDNESIKHVYEIYRSGKEFSFSESNCNFEISVSSMSVNSKCTSVKSYLSSIYDVIKMNSENLCGEYYETFGICLSTSANDSPSSNYVSYEGNFDSLALRSELSVCLSTVQVIPSISEVYTVSVISFLGSILSSGSSGNTENIIVDNTQYSEQFSNQRIYEDYKSDYAIIAEDSKSSILLNNSYRHSHIRDVYVVYRSENKMWNRLWKKKKDDEHVEDYTDEDPAQDGTPIVVINSLKNNMSPDVMQMVNNILSRKSISDSESVFVLVSDGIDSDNSYDSTIGIQITESPASSDFTNFNWESCSDTQQHRKKRHQIFPVSRGFKITAKGKNPDKMKEIETLYENTRRSHAASNKKHLRIVEPTINDDSSYTYLYNPTECSHSSLKIKKKPLTRRGHVATDTTSDRPCSCQGFELASENSDEEEEHTSYRSHSSVDRLVATVSSTPHMRTLVHHELTRSILVGTNTDAGTDTTADRPCHCEVLRQESHDDLHPYCSQDHVIATCTTSACRTGGTQDLNNSRNKGEEQYRESSPTKSHKKMHLFKTPSDSCDDACENSLTNKQKKENKEREKREKKKNKIKKREKEKECCEGSVYCKHCSDTCSGKNKKQTSERCGDMMHLKECPDPNNQPPCPTPNTQGPVCPAHAQAIPPCPAQDPPKLDQKRCKPTTVIPIGNELPAYQSKPNTHGGVLKFAEFSKKNQLPCNSGCGSPFFSRVTANRNPGVDYPTTAKLVPLRNYAPDLDANAIEQFKRKVYGDYLLSRGSGFRAKAVPCSSCWHPPVKGQQRHLIGSPKASLPNSVVIVLNKKAAKCQCTSDEPRDKDCRCEFEDSQNSDQCLCHDATTEFPSIVDLIGELSAADIALINKMRSDMTQTVSGFKISKRGAIAVDQEMSFEEALHYFSEERGETVGHGHVRQQGYYQSGFAQSVYSDTRGCYLPGMTGIGVELGATGSHEGCTCEDPFTLERLTKCPEKWTKVECECPEDKEAKKAAKEAAEEAAARVAEEEAALEAKLFSPSGHPLPLTKYDIPGPEMGIAGNFLGIKLVIGGKGSGSQGLSGICCFDLTIDSKPVMSKSKSEISSTSIRSN